jgi:hypothetical protein
MVVLLSATALGCGSSDDGGGSGGKAGSGGTSNGGSGGGGGTTSGGSGGGGGSQSGGGTTGGGGSGGTSTGGGSGQGLSAKYPGDVGIENDPDVVWTENFEEGSTTAFFARYEDKKTAGFSLDPDKPAKSSGSASGKLTANGAGPNAVDFYKNLAPGYDELYVRYYVKYGSGAQWHHTGVWVGGYNPASNWPNPQAGLKPNGDDRFSVSFEPMGPSPNPRMDFYNYWMKMHSWMDQPSGNTAYYGNSLVHQKAVIASDNQWMCVEIHIKLNPDPSSGAGAELGLWIDDQSVIQFDDQAPKGCWIKDKFCSQSVPLADSKECTDYPNLCKTPYVPLDLQYRSTTDLKLNAFWPQNYITSGGAGSVWYDDMIVAKSRIGCIH